jgi:hypothetical protein
MTDHRKQEVDKELRQIYEDRDGEIPDLTKLEYRRTSRVTRMLVKTVVALLVIAGVAWGGFFLWRPYAIKTSHPLTTAVEGPVAAASGETVAYRIRYENSSDVPIAALELKLNLPENFILEESRPTSTEGSVWVIGSLTPGSDGSVDLTGTFRSAVPSTEKIQAFFTYRPANFSSDFQEIASLSVGVERSILTLTAEGPEKGLPGDAVSYVAHLTNSGAKRMENIRVRQAFPAAFELSSMDPAPTAEGVTYWDIASLEPGETKDLTVSGSYTTSASGTLDVMFEVGLLDAEGVFMSQGQAGAGTDILGGNLAVHLIANGSDSGQTLDLGDTVRVSIDYANQGSETIEDVSFALLIETDEKAVPISWENAELSDARQEGNTLIWDADAIASLASLSPNAAGVIDLTLPVFSTLDPATLADAFSLKLSATMQKVGSVVAERTIETSPIGIRLNSDARFAGSASYFAEDGTPYGSGPLPPKVDETTTYRVFWDLSNSLHPLQNVSVTTNLPPDVSWVSRAGSDIGSIVYNETTRLITWSVDSLPTAVSAAEAWFDLAITPDEADVGTFMKLTNATAFEATDAETQDTVHASVGVLDTEIPNDALAAGKGVVID